MNAALAQYRAYHKEDLKKYKQKSKATFQVDLSPYSYGLRNYYRPQQFQGLEVISMNRPGGTHDDVYFIDKKGNTQYHTVRPTAPIRRYQPNRYGVHDSSNPSGHEYQSVGHAVLEGVATMLSGLLMN